MTYEIDTKIPLAKLVNCPNICKLLSEEDCKAIGLEAQAGYMEDKRSRQEWEERSARSMELALQVYKEKSFPWEHCYTPDTEALTISGWKRIGDIRLGELIYTRDENACASYAPVTKTFAGRSEKMVHFLGKSIDLMVTPNHKMLIETATGRTKFVEADHFIARKPTGWYVPLTSHWQGQEMNPHDGVPLDAYCRFVGWYVSEGSCNRPKNNLHFGQDGFIDYGPTTGSFSIAQSWSANAAKCLDICVDITACGFTYKAQKNGMTVHAKSMPESVKAELRGLGLAPDKYIPEWMLSLPRKNLLSLLDALVSGDGHQKANGSRIYHTVSFRLADQIMELCQKVGLRGTMIERTENKGMIDGREIVGKHTLYTVRINRKSRIKVSTLERSVVNYGGDIVCVEVAPTHTLYVRRNGKAVWSGNSSNVKVPLITIAALQFQALAYPAIVDAPDLVKCMVYGDDPGGQKNARSDRIATHMSWQNLEQDRGWEEAHDKALLVQSIAGNAFIKKIYDPSCGHNITQLVLPANFVINYFSADIDTSLRYTHTFNLTQNAIRTREIDGRFTKDDDGDEVPTTPPAIIDNDQLKQAQNERQGLSAPADGSTTPYFTGEQYCWWDLDGDGYQEPYIVTFDIGSGCVRRIAPRFLPSGVKLSNGKMLHDYAADDGFDVPPNLKVYVIEPVKVFTKLPFVPSPDGGFYDIGLGQLLGDINEAANASINQIFDAGTMATLGGGFLGRGFKNRAGPFSMKPFMWYPIDAPGDDLHKNILPLPIREPSPVLFQVLQFLIQYAEKITQTTEIGMGENPGQNTPAQTTQTLDQNGKRMMNAIFKRTWRAFRDEYRIQYELNSLFLPESEWYYDLTQGKTALIQQSDYAQPSIDVRPAADPFIVSEVQRQQTADAVLAASQQMPGFNRYQTGLRWLKARKVPDIQAIYPPLPKDPQTGQPMTDFPPPGPDPKMIQAQVAQGKLQLATQESQADAMRARIELMLSVQKIGAEILNLQSQATLYEAQAKTVESEPAIKLIYAQIEAQSAVRNHILQVVDTLANLHLGHKQLQLDAKKEGVNMPGATSPSDAVAQTNGEMLGSLQ